MAENVVSFLLDNLARYLTQEVDLLHGFEDEVKMLQNDLTMIDAFLKDSEAEQNENDEVQEVVEQIRDVGREAEDVVDTCVANLIMQRRKKSLSKLLNRFSHASMLRHVVEKIKSLQKTITQIYDNTDRYGIRQIHPSPLISDTEQIPLQRRRWENVEEYDDDDHVVGFEQDATTLVKYLTDGDSGRHVVSLFGMGGLGKTTLAEKIYNDSRIKNHFDCQAWGYVSQQYRGKDLFYGMLKCLTPISYEMRKMSEDELKNTLRAFLREKRYFIVMDDIWKLDVWNEVRQVLPDSFNGSRILITTRVKDVAMYSSQTPPYALSFLDNKTSFQLFCRKVFGKQKCPSDLENLAMKLVKSCKGLPISIVVLGDPRDPCHARSLVMFGEGNKFDMKHWRWIHKSLKFIRVLCLENMHVDSIPKEIGKLIFLRYLRIWSETLVRIHSIPSSICKLQYLETIGINGHVEECLPMGFWKMKQLRHLKISGGIRFPSTPAPFDDILLNLQVLSYLLVDEKTTHLNALSRVPNVRKLHLKYDVSKPMNEFEVAELLESLENLKQLQKLKLFDIPKSEPRSNLFPPTLIKLTFIRSYLNSAHFRILGKLPNLQFLKIKGKFLGFNILHPLCCVAGEFPSLQVFQMIGLEIEKWEMEGGSMPKLDRLVIFECYKLRNLPEELWSSTSLRLVEVSRMSESFMKMIKELKMKDGCKILIDSNPQNI
ncbi:hypothetical protein FEM48_Zijuj12G0186300 [Ziziphus jujuba var. spinosa]|uniref:Disease resistance RPP13-like protein 3 n=1 Tax=Ziziphus jujuba var. spinosa TaxID=714518 RepID=A0A978UEW5_ZIZJJ|nr:hypothetical protein FEM48_Zijuj12G0186300 [Ziziphus jujuba var. spinosa]